MQRVEMGDPPWRRRHHWFATAAAAGSGPGSGWNRASCRCRVVWVRCADVAPRWCASLIMRPWVDSAAVPDRGGGSGGSPTPSNSPHDTRCLRQWPFVHQCGSKAKDCVCVFLFIASSTTRFVGAQRDLHCAVVCLSSNLCVSLSDCSLGSLEGLVDCSSEHVLH